MNLVKIKNASRAVIELAQIVKKSVQKDVQLTGILCKLHEMNYY